MDDPPQAFSPSWQAVALLLDDLAHSPLHACEHNFIFLIEGLAELLHASSSFAVFIQHGTAHPTARIMQGWHPTHVAYLNAQPVDRKILQKLNEAISTEGTMLHKGISEHIAHVGTHRAMLWSDLTRGEAFTEHVRFQDLYAPLNIYDRMFLVLSIDPQLEIIFCLDRLDEQPRFGPEERDFARLLFKRIWPTAIRYCAFMGFLQSQLTLSPRERETLMLLLKGLSEKEVGVELGVTTRSAHQYVTTIYRKLQVNSRAQLMALWLDPPAFEARASPST